MKQLNAIKVRIPDDQLKKATTAVYILAGALIINALINRKKK